MTMPSTDPAFDTAPVTPSSIVVDDASALRSALASPMMNASPPTSVFPATDSRTTP